ncbi:MAG: alpha amylase C-terminal domain-containing protein, partial [Acidimicrobiia bacterium]|nr:alpha amylase C-terminal domain-containing protein [Acidimicrobiia bacterium]
RWAATAESKPTPTPNTDASTADGDIDEATATTAGAGQDDLPARRRIEPVVVVHNFTPVPRGDYTIGVPVAGRWVELANSDDTRFGGSGVSCGPLETADEPAHSQAWSLKLTVPPLATVFLVPASTEDG